MSVLKTKLIFSMLSASLLVACGGGSSPFSGISGSGVQALYDFESTAATYDLDGWTIEDDGDAFDAKSPAGGWTDTNTGFFGSFLVDSFRDGDASTGRMTSETTTINKRYLNLVIGGGNHTDLGGAPTQVKVLIDGDVHHIFTGTENRELASRSLDLGRFQGSDLQIVIEDQSAAGWGFILADQFTLSDSIDGNADYVIETFDDTSGLTKTGSFSTAFDLQGRTRVGEGRSVGTGAVGSCELNDADADPLTNQGCDTPVGTVETATFEVNQRYFVGAVTGACNQNDRYRDLGVDLYRGNTLVQRYQPIFQNTELSDEGSWISLDLEDFDGDTLKAVIRDGTDGGCGFIAADHFYLSDQARGRETIKQVVLETFDDATQSTWTATGAFANPTVANAWEGVTRNNQRFSVGANAVSTCEIGGAGCDAPTGTLTSPAFTVPSDAANLSFLMTGGNGGAAQVGLNVRLASDDSIVKTFTPNACGVADLNDDTAEIPKYIDLSAYAGQSIKVEIFDNEPGGCGFIAFDEIYLTNREHGTEVAN